MPKLILHLLILSMAYTILQRPRKFWISSHAARVITFSSLLLFTLRTMWFEIKAAFSTDFLYINGHTLDHYPALEHRCGRQCNQLDQKMVFNRTLKIGREFNSRTAHITNEYKKSPSERYIDQIGTIFYRTSGCLIVKGGRNESMELKGTRTKV